MTTGSKNGRAAARVAWETIKAYLEEKNDKRAQFESADLDGVGVPGYSSRGLFRLREKSVIKTIDRPRGQGKTVIKLYTLNDRFFNYSLEEILKFSYDDAYKKA